MDSQRIKALINPIFSSNGDMDSQNKSLEDNIHDSSRNGFTRCIGGITASTDLYQSFSSSPTRVSVLSQSGSLANPHLSSDIVSKETNNTCNRFDASDGSLIGHQFGHQLSAKSMDEMKASKTRSQRVKSFGKYLRRKAVKVIKFFNCFKGSKKEKNDPNFNIKESEDQIMTEPKASDQSLNKPVMTEPIVSITKSLDDKNIESSEQSSQLSQDMSPNNLLEESKEDNEKEDNNKISIVDNTSVITNVPKICDNPISYLSHKLPQDLRLKAKPFLPELEDNGIHLGKYINCGGIGYVVKGNHFTNGDKPLAVKIYDRQVFQGITEFVDEMDLMIELKHKNIIGLDYVINNEDIRFLVMPFARTDLMHYIRTIATIENQLMSESEIRNFFTQILCGVQYMHEKGFAHRDLKPENILICGDIQSPVLKISDFDFTTKAVDENGDLISSNRSCGKY